MPEKLLDHAQVGPTVEEVGGEGVAQRMGVRGRGSEAAQDVLAALGDILGRERLPGN